MNMNEIVKNVTLTKACSIKPDKDSAISKVINLKIKFDGVTLGAVFQKALSGTVITWQNSKGRKNFDSYKANQTIELSFSAPSAAPQIDPEMAMVQKLQGMTSEEQAKYISEMLKKASPIIPEPIELVSEDEDEDDEDEEETE